MNLRLLQQNVQVFMQTNITLYSPQKLGLIHGRAMTHKNAKQFHLIHALEEVGTYRERKLDCLIVYISAVYRHITNFPMSQVIRAYLAWDTK